MKPLKLTRRNALGLVPGTLFASNLAKAPPHPDEWTRGFQDPPHPAKPWVYWWWLQDLVDKEGITRDMEEFRAKGIGGALLFVAGGPAGPTPIGPAILSPEWRVLFRHALAEANRVGLQMSVNLTCGWDMGGPWVTPEKALKQVVNSELVVEGPAQFSGKLPPLPGNPAGVWDIAVHAFPTDKGRPLLATGPVARKYIFERKVGENRNWTGNFLGRGIRPNVEAPLKPLELLPGETPLDPALIVDLSSRLTPDGHLEWEVPAGRWTILRTGYSITGKRTIEAFAGSDGLEVDFLNTAGIDLQFEKMGKILLADAGPLAGKVLLSFHDDSWEDRTPNWTEGFAETFRRIHGYDPLPYLPAISGRVVKSAEITDRFFHDFGMSVAYCLAEGHYARFRDLCHESGILVQNESGGPSSPEMVAMDALRNLGRSDVPMGEFWQSEHWKEHGQNTNGKQTASACHIYGRKVAAAEAFTRIGPDSHYFDAPVDLKPTADIAFCEGINRFVCHTATCTRPRDGKPGNEYFAGTHFNPNVTWWNQAGPWVKYITRCQFLLQRGLFVAEVCYYSGDIAPNYVEPKHVDPSLGAGYDYDVCNTEVLLTRMEARDGRIVLPDGMSYRMLALPDFTEMPVEVVHKLRDLVAAGATVVGPKPSRDPGLRNYPACDQDLQRTAQELWGDCDGVTVTEHRYGKGRVIWGKSLREVLNSDGVSPDFEYAGAHEGAWLDYIHRRDGDAEIYFVANRRSRTELAKCVFRDSTGTPELWDPITGRVRAAAYTRAGGRTAVELEFAPYGSTFVVFRRGETRGRTPRSNRLALAPLRPIEGGWRVSFDPKWGGPESVAFDRLESWTERAEPGIRYYSGAAVYRKRFDLPSKDIAAGGRIFLSLGEIKNIAQVRLNGKDLGVVWTKPFRIEITGVASPGNNELEIAVTNLWANRLIGDAALPPEKRLTRTNVTLPKDRPLLDSGLFGPVELMVSKASES